MRNVPRYIPRRIEKIITIIDTKERKFTDKLYVQKPISPEIVVGIEVIESDIIPFRAKILNIESVGSKYKCKDVAITKAKNAILNIWSNVSLTLGLHLSEASISLII